MTDFLQCAGVRRQYDAGVATTVALRGVSLTIQESEIVSITGPSGSGKSTLLNLLSGLDAPSSGRVLYQGRDINKLTAKEKSRFRLEQVGFVFQFFNLIPNLTAFDNAILPAVLNGQYDKTGLVDDLMEAVGLSDKKHSMPNELSGGEQQRIAIIRAMVNSPKIIFADEPTGNLDSQTGGQVIGLLMDRARLGKQTLVYVTHDAGLAGLADRRIEIMDGEIIRETSHTTCLS